MIAEQQGQQGDCRQHGAAGCPTEQWCMVLEVSLLRLKSHGKRVCAVDWCCVHRTHICSCLQKSFMKFFMKFV